MHRAQVATIPLVAGFSGIPGAWISPGKGMLLSRRVRLLVTDCGYGVAFPDIRG
jgi:hypothetical protein